MGALFRDILIIAGLAGILYGTWQFSPPVVYILSGCLLLTLAAVLYRGTVRRKQRPR